MNLHIIVPIRLRNEKKNIDVWDRLKKLNARNSNSGVRIENLDDTLEDPTFSGSVIAVPILVT